MINIIIIIIIIIIVIIEFFSSEDLISWIYFFSENKYYSKTIARIFDQSIFNKLRNWTLHGEFVSLPAKIRTLWFSALAYLIHDLEVPTSNTGTINKRPFEDTHRLSCILRGRCWQSTFRQVAATSFLKNNMKHHYSTRMEQWRYAPTHS